MNGKFAKICRRKEHKYIRTALCKAAEFLVCSLLGWSYEILLTWAVCGRFINRGAFGVPFCPIYGIGAFLMYAAVKFSRAKGTGKIFFTCALAASAFELAASYAIEAVMGHGLWSYARWAVNFDGRISLFSSLIFGSMGVLYIKVIHPFFTDKKPPV